MTFFTHHYTNFPNIITVDNSMSLPACHTREEERDGDRAEHS